jgi:hypothetical protein
MLTFLQDILENRADAFARALAATEDHIRKSGGAWFGAGAKGCFLLLKGSTFADPTAGGHYIRAGNALLDAALLAAKNQTTLEAHLLHYMSGCAYGAVGDYDRAKTEFAFSEDGHLRLDDWCIDWCQIVLASATDDPETSKHHFTTASNRDAARAANLYEIWTSRTANP